MSKVSWLNKYLKIQQTTKLYVLNYLNIDNTTNKFYKIFIDFFVGNTASLASDL